MKYFSTFLLLCSLFTVKLKVFKIEVVLISLLMIFFALSILITSLNGGDISRAISYNFFIIIIIIYIYLIKHVNKIKVLNFTMNAFFYSSLMIISGNIFSLLFPIEPIIKFLKIFAMNYDNYDGIRQNTSNLFPKIYFHFTLFLPSALAYFLFNKKHLKSLLLLIAILLSVSRGGIFISLLVVFLYFFNIQSTIGFMKKSILFLFFILTMIYVIDYFVPSLFLHIQDLNNASNDTVSTRINQINIILGIFENNPFSLLFGMGSGTPFYSTFLNEYAYHIEIAPLEIIRKYGLFFLLFIFGFMFKIIFENLKTNKRNSIILLSLLLATFTNPILTSPMFILIYFLCNKSSPKLSL